MIPEPAIFESVDNPCCFNAQINPIELSPAGPALRGGNLFGADEGARHGAAHLVETAREAVDHLLQRHVAQAGVGQPEGEQDRRHRHDRLIPAAASSSPWAAPRSGRRCPMAG